MRVRIPELLAARQMTPYAVAKASRGRISMSAAYRLARERGKFQFFDADLLEALCDVLVIAPTELFERDTQPVAAPPPKKRKKRG